MKTSYKLSKITKQEVLEALHYDRENDCFYWKNKTSNSIKIGQIAGSSMPEGYWRIGINGQRYLAHRLVWLMETGCFPDSDIDHIDRDKSNSIFSNLRLATRSENKQNSENYCNNKSGFKGVSFYKLSGKFKAQLSINGKKKHLGYFETPELANEAYKAASLKYHNFSIYA